MLEVVPCSSTMQVYLVQHGLAKSKEEDPERPLTAAGREEVERVARAAAAAGVRPAKKGARGSSGPAW